jgi:hypothetical protein
MASTTRPLAVLNLPRTVSGVIYFARSVATGMSDNPAFPDPFPSIPTFSADITALEAAEADVLSRLRGTAEIRDEKWATVCLDLGHLKAYVQWVADADPSQAEALIANAGMSAKKIGSRAKGELEVTQGIVSGLAHLVAKAAARRAAYEWQYGTDRKTWISAPPTLGAQTDIGGLTPGVLYFFRFRSLTKEGESAWSQVVTLLVQ